MERKKFFECVVCKLEFKFSCELAKHFYSHIHVLKEFVTHLQSNPLDSLHMDALQMLILNEHFFLWDEKREHMKCIVCENTKWMPMSNYSKHVRLKDHLLNLRHRLDSLYRRQLPSDNARKDIDCPVCQEKFDEVSLIDHVTSQAHIIEDLNCSRFVDRIVDVSQSNVGKSLLSEIDERGEPVLIGENDDPEDRLQVPTDDGQSENSDTVTETASQSCSAYTELRSETNASKSCSANTEFDSPRSGTRPMNSAPSLRTSSGYVSDHRQKPPSFVYQISDPNLRKMTEECLETVPITGPAQSEQYICNICKSKLNGIEPVKQHMASMQHRRRYTTARRSNAANFSGLASPSYHPGSVHSAPALSQVQHEQMLFPKGPASVAADSGYCLSEFSRISSRSNPESVISSVSTHPQQNRMGQQRVFPVRRESTGVKSAKCVHCGTENISEFDILQPQSLNAPLASERGVGTGSVGGVKCVGCAGQTYPNREPYQQPLYSDSQNNHPTIAEVGKNHPGTTYSELQTAPVRTPQQINAGNARSSGGQRASAGGGGGGAVGGGLSSGVSTGRSSSAVSSSAVPSSVTSSVHRNYKRCDLCGVDFTDIKHANDHYNGKKHQKKMLSVDASALDAMSGGSGDRGNGEQGEETAIVKSSSVQNFNDYDETARTVELEKYYKERGVVATTPRHYQHDLFRRVMLDDYSYYCFLPTGLGKTLVACLIMREMLELNWGQRGKVFFVTDKVLLTLQQMQYIRDQFKAQKSHYIKVAASCGERIETEKNVNIRDHHIFLFTAEFLRVRLQRREAFNWGDVCCVVFDEVHHCDAKHPYNALVQEFHLPLVHAEKPHPKLIGLTASPAIDKTGAEKTMEVLKQRLNIFGRARLVTGDKEELTEYVVMPNISYKMQNTSQNYLEFAEAAAVVIDVFIADNLSTGPMSVRLTKKITDLCQVGKRKPFDESWLFTMDQECERLIESMVQSSSNAGEDDPLMGPLGFLLDLFETIFLARFVSLYEAFFLLEGLASPTPSSACPVALEETERQRDSVLNEFRERAENDLNSLDAPYHSIIDEIRDTFGEPSRNIPVVMDQKFLLILVTTRCFALSLTRVLSKDLLLEKLGLKVGCVVGHGGTNSAVKGMSVRKQHQALIDMKNKQIFVATSVAEEGIDVPSCEKVILLSAPKDTTAFVQIRGRARKQHSSVVFIGNQQEREKMESLISNEQYMLQAVQQYDNRIFCAPPPPINRNKNSSRFR